MDEVIPLHHSFSQFVMFTLPSSYTAFLIVVDSLKKNGRECCLLLKQRHLLFSERVLMEGKISLRGSWRK